MQADDGRTIIAFKPAPDPISGEVNEDFKTNCHGTTFAEGEFWINGDQIPDIIEGDNYETVSRKKNVSEGDVAVWSDVKRDEKGYIKSKVVKHSATVTKKGEEKNDIDVTGLGGDDTEVKTDNYKNAWDDGQVEFLRKGE